MIFRALTCVAFLVLSISHSRTPAAALTAYATPADRTRALLAGFQVYLAKPFDPSELVTLVAHLAGRAPAA